MKKNVLIKSAIAVAIAAATTATTIADTKLYGRFRAGVVCTNVGNDECGLENGSSRFGIKADHQVSDGLTAFGRYEFAVDLDEGSLNSGGNANRLAYVGVKGGFGEVSVGSRWTPMYNYVGSPVDPYQMFGGGGGALNLSTGRESDTINYKNKFGGGSVHVMAQMDDDGADDFDAFEIGGGFKAGSVNLGLVYGDAKDLGTTIGVHAGTNLGAFGVGVSYINNDPDAAGADDVDGITLLGVYKMGGGKSLKLNFGQVDLGAVEPTTLGFEYEHKLSKNYHWFAGVSSDDDDVDGTDDVLKYGAGMRLEF